ncbi:CpsD/CapB family tyrosine-protein kinase [bacterium]|nr:CpsD/CapB family tyrosine-protein kinase [bacterium]
MKTSVAKFKKSAKPLGYYLETPELNEFKRLFNRLHTEKQKHGTKVFMITSAMMSEGKSTVAAYLAVTSALYQSTETVLVDCDLRRPVIHRHYELPLQPGIAEVLSRELDLSAAIKPSALPHLKIITAGKPNQTPAELFSLTHLQSVVDEMREKFSIIIFDAPPIIPVSDTLLLSNFVDGILIVVKAGKSQKRVTQRALDMLQTNSDKILGVVVNNLRSALPYYYDHRYYGYKYYRQIENANAKRSDH